MTPDELHSQYHAMSPETRAAIEGIKEDISDIRNNHLKHIEDDVAVMKATQQVHGNDLVWLKRIGAFVIIQGVTTIVAVLLK